MASWFLGKTLHFPHQASLWGEGKGGGEGMLLEKKKNYICFLKLFPVIQNLFLDIKLLF